MAWLYWKNPVARPGRYVTLATRQREPSVDPMNEVTLGRRAGGRIVSTEDLDTAIAAVKAAAAELRTAPSADVGPADVSAVIGALRELVWNVTSLTGVVAARYENIGALRHDHGDDPAVAVEMIGLRLGEAQGWLVQVDESLGATHDHAARLARS